MSANLRKLVGVAIGLAIAVPLLLLMFTGPASRGAPHELPIGVAGPAPATAAVTAQLQAHRPGAFAVHTYADAGDLIAATADREVYGGLVLGPEPRTVIATGASPTAAALLTGLGESVSPDRGPTVTDVAPPAAEDPHGAGFGSMVMPIFLAGIVLAVLGSLLGRRAVVVAVFVPLGAAVVGAAAVAATMAIGILPGGFWVQWLAFSAGVLAIAAAASGFIALVGLPGVGVAAGLFLVIGMPLSGIMSPPEFLPWVWGTVGQWLPLGATGTALRSAAFFGADGPVGPGAGGAFLALGTWVVVGYALLAVGAARHHGSATDHDEPGLTENDLPQPATM